MLNQDRFTMGTCQKPSKSVFGTAFLIFIIACSATAQTKSLDSLKRALTKTEGKTRVTTLLELCWQYRFINADTARSYGLIALDLARKEKIEDLEAEALNNIGVTHEAQGNYDEALAYEAQALNLRKKLDDPSKIANTLNSLGIIYDERGDYEKALSHYFDARKIYEELQDESKIAMVLTNIGIVLRAQKEYKNVVSYYRKAMAIYQKLGNKFGLAACHSNLGAVYLSLTNYDSAVYYSLLASEEFEAQNVRQFLPTTLSNTAIAYAKTGQTEKAKIYFIKAKKLHEEYNNKKELSFTLSQLARLEAKQGNKTGAVAYGEQALSIAKNIKAMEQIMQAYESLAESKAQSADFKGAYHAHVDYGATKDSLFQQQKSKQLLELQTKYETNKNKHEIALLDQENKLKAAAIERNYFIIGGLVSVLTVFALLVYVWRYRAGQQQKTVAQQQKLRMRELQINSVIESQEQERKRFASDLHDGMGQLVSALQLTIQSIKNTRDQEKTISLVDNSEQLLSDIQSEIRNIAFNLMPPILVKEGLIPATKELIRRVNKAANLKSDVIIHDVADRLPDLVEISLYRIIQELVSNIIKHGNASYLTLSFTGYTEEILLIIEDDGIGYDLASFQNSKQSNGWRTIQTRIQLMKGQIEFDTMVGRKNNTVTIHVPMKQVHEEIMSEVKNTEK
jgi:signal transduction histidine kinase